MARSVRSLMDRLDLALIEARSRIRPNPRDRLTPTARKMVEAWEAERTLEQQYAAWRDGVHILSTADIWDDRDIADATPEQIVAMWDEMRDEGKPAR